MAKPINRLRDDILAVQTALNEAYADVVAVENATVTRDAAQAALDKANADLATASASANTADELAKLTKAQGLIDVLETTIDLTKKGIVPPPATPGPQAPGNPAPATGRFNTSAPGFPVTVWKHGHADEVVHNQADLSKAEAAGFVKK